MHGKLDWNLFDGIWDNPAKRRVALWALGMITAGTAAGAGISWAIHRPMFALNGIRIQGAHDQPLRHVAPATAKAIAMPHITGNFLTTDLDKARQSFESIGWVRKASVRREWPNKLAVTLEEHVPVGLWGTGGHLVSNKGIVFMANIAEAETYGEMLHFSGPPGSEQDVVRRYLDLQQWLAPIKLFPVAISLSNRLSWSVTLHNGTTMELGRDETGTQVKERIDRLVGVYPKLIAKLGNRLERIDLRYAHGFAIKTKAANISRQPLAKSAPTPAQEGDQDHET